MFQLRKPLTPASSALTGASRRTSSTSPTLTLSTPTRPTAPSSTSASTESPPEPRAASSASSSTPSPLPVIHPKMFRSGELPQPPFFSFKNFGHSKILGDFFPFSWYIGRLQLINFTMVNDDRKQERRRKSIYRSIKHY